MVKAKYSVLCITGCATCSVTGGAVGVLRPAWPRAHEQRMAGAMVL